MGDVAAEKMALVATEGEALAVEALAVVGTGEVDVLAGEGLEVALGKAVVVVWPASRQMSSHELSWCRLARQLPM